MFIIGNGFDLGHDLHTNYGDFRSYLEDNQEEFLRDFEKSYDISFNNIGIPLWNDLEGNLANIDEDLLFDEMYQQTDLGLESGNIEIEDTLIYHFRKSFKYIEKLTIYLKDWIEQVNLGLVGLNRRTSFIQKDNQDIYINFNYTTILEDVYKIPEENILHIHGVVSSESDLVLGHSSTNKIDYFNEQYNKFHNQFDEQRAPIYKALAEYCYKTYKDVNSYIDELFSLEFESIEKVIVIGHSLGTVDLPYFQRIKENIDKDVEWKIYYYAEKQIEQFAKQLGQIGVSTQQIQFISSTSLYDLPILLET